MNINAHIDIPDAEIDLAPIRAQGAGGQNVNKVSSAIHLRFDISSSSLPADCKTALLQLRDQRISKDGVLVIKAQQFRTQEKNRDDAFDRMRCMILRALHKPKIRKATRPTRGSQLRRLGSKTKNARTKKLRGRVGDRD